jgi:hypothetical protein
MPGQLAVFSDGIVGGCSDDERDNHESGVISKE